jgi:hypothetical protein
MWWSDADLGPQRANLPKALRGVEIPYRAQALCNIIEFPKAAADLHDQMNGLDCQQLSVHRVQKHETQVPIRNYDVVLMRQNRRRTCNRALTNMEATGKVSTKEPPHRLFAFNP